MNEAKRGFYADAGFLRDIGAIDCTHMQLVPLTPIMCTGIIHKHSTHNL